jgi:hypothetical protein
VARPAGQRVATPGGPDMGAGGGIALIGGALGGTSTIKTSSDDH